MLSRVWLVVGLTHSNDSDGLLRVHGAAIVESVETSDEAIASGTGTSRSGRTRRVVGVESAVRGHLERFGEWRCVLSTDCEEMGV